MSDSTNVAETPKPKESPLVFISHDSRDAELAEAFAKLLRTVSAGMLKSFWSSDMRGREGIEFGDEWYKVLMTKLSAATDVVCLLTKRSLERPWLLYEAGVAKGNKGTPVHGIALGIPLKEGSTGPFYQFQNSDDSEASLTKLVLQLCHRVPELDPDHHVVKEQVKAFKEAIRGILTRLDGAKQIGEREIEDNSIAQLLEELKIVVRHIPQQIEQSILHAQRSYAAPVIPSPREPRNSGKNKEPSQVNGMNLLSRRLQALSRGLIPIDTPSSSIALAASAAVALRDLPSAMKSITELKVRLDLLLVGDQRSEFTDSQLADIALFREKVSELARMIYEAIGQQSVKSNA